MFHGSSSTSHSVSPTSTETAISAGTVGRQAACRRLGITPLAGEGQPLPRAYRESLTHEARLIDTGLLLIRVVVSVHCPKIMIRPSQDVVGG